MERAIQICKPGTMYREIGNVIGKYIEENGFAFISTKNLFLQDCQLSEPIQVMG